MTIYGADKRLLFHAAEFCGRCRIGSETNRNEASSTCFFVAQLARSVEHETLNLRVVGLDPTLGATVT